MRFAAEEVAWERAVLGGEEAVGLLEAEEDKKGAGDGEGGDGAGVVPGVDDAAAIDGQHARDAGAEDEEGSEIV